MRRLLFIAVGTPPDEDGSADLSHVLAVAQTIGRSLDRLRGGRQQVHRARRHRRPRARGDRRGTRPPWRKRAVRRRFESRVSQGRRRGQGLPAAGSHRDRLGQRPRDRAAEDAVCAVQPQSRAHRADGRAFGRTDEVRRERDARDEDQLHERDGEHRRTRRRGHRTRAPRHRFGSAHRLLVHLSGRGLRRFVLSEGRARARAHRAQAWLRGTPAELPSKRSTMRRRKSSTN